MHTVGDSLREGFLMFWETLWALVLGFALSGAVQAFVSRDRMRRTLGDHRPVTVAKASALGMVSSSCSYAASAMANSLFQKGADFISAMVFMFASTNLVLELGIVMVVLMGWQFAGAEAVGGVVMIVLLVIVGARVLAPRLIAAARRPASLVDAAGSVARPWATVAGWADAAGYAIADLRMVRRELVVGFVVAGFLDVAVPAHVYRIVLLSGHGALSSVENAIVGPLIACVSFVCSIGNVPMAAALWESGTRFGGVVSFVFADLLALPLVFVYRKYYGGALTARLVLVFWAVMVAAGLVVEAVFSALGLVPRPGHVIARDVTWNYTAWLNLLAVVVLVTMFVLRRRRGDRFAVDPVCGMQVEIAHAPAHRVVEGGDLWFCSDQCAARFDASRARST